MPDPATATDAAVVVARAHGVRCDEAVRLPGASNVLVHLRPSPVVARVMTATAVLHDDVSTWLRRELAVGAFLGARESPSRRRPCCPRARTATRGCG